MGCMLLKEMQDRYEAELDPLFAAAVSGSRAYSIRLKLATLFLVE